MEHWLICCILLDIGVIIANTIEQLIICCKWKTMDRIEHFLLSLSLSDLIFGVVTLGIDSWHLVSLGSSNTTGIVANGTLKIGNIANPNVVINMAFNSVFLFSILASVFHVMAIAVERLCVIKFPKKYFLLTSFTVKSCTIFMIWVSAVVIATFCAVSSHLFDTDIGKHLLGSLLLVIASLVFVIDMVVAYFLMRLRKFIIPDYSSECITSQDHRLRRETIVYFFMGISFIVCTLPIGLGYFDRSLYHHISNVMITTNSLINPCIYFAKVYVDSRKLTRPRSETTHELLATRSFSVLEDDNDAGQCVVKRITKETFCSVAKTPESRSIC